MSSQLTIKHCTTGFGLSSGPRLTASAGRRCVDIVRTVDKVPARAACSRVVPASSASGQPYPPARPRWLPPLKATHQQTKAHNNRLVLRTIYDFGEISRAEVARQTELSRTTVSEVVTDLLQQELVEEIGYGPSSGGKSPILLHVKSNARYLIGVDLSSEEFRAAVVNLRGEVQHTLSLPRNGRGGDDALALVYELLDQLTATNPALPLLGLGVGTPGLVDVRRGNQVHWAVNLDWLDLPLRELLEARYRLPVHVLNDSQASAMAEYYFGGPRTSDNLVLIKCEQGVGAGIVIEGQLFYGDLFGAGEIGHVVIAENSQVCRCGNIGCLETVASAAAVLRRVRVVTANRSSPAHPDETDGRPVSMRAVKEWYDLGDRTVQLIVHDAGRALGIAIANLVGALNIHRIVIAGSLGVLGPPLLEIIQAEMRRRSLAALASETQVHFSALGPDITILGAAAVLLQAELGITPK
jgi:N-acetylglucosamine repressor